MEWNANEIGELMRATKQNAATSRIIAKFNELLSIIGNIFVEDDDVVVLVIVAMQILADEAQHGE